MKFSMHPLLSLRLTLFSALILFAGCASVTSQKIPGAPENNLHALPSRIYVKHFTFSEQGLRVDRSGAKLAAFQQTLAQKLSTLLIQRLTRHLAPADLFPNGQVPPRQNAWLIVGRFERVEQGSRALRALFGFGLGATKIVTAVEVYDLNTPKPTRIMTLRTSGGSNAVPGTVTNLPPIAIMGPVGALPGILLGGGVGAFPGLGDDAKRTAREITATLSDYCYQNHLIGKNQAMRPKQPGHFQLRLSDPKRPASSGSVQVISTAP